MTYRLLLSLSVMLGCRSAEPASGTSVGNPGKLNPSVGAGEGVMIREAWGEVAAINMTTCTGTVLEIVVDDNIALNGSESIDIPNGAYCSVQLVMAGSLEIEAIWLPEDWEDDWDEEEGIEFSMAIPIEDLTIVNSDDGFDVDGTPLVLELGEPSWLHSDDIDVEEDDVDRDEDGLFFDEDTPQSRHAANNIWKTSALWNDDGDGQVSDEERDDGPLATTDQDKPSVEKAKADEGGCATAPFKPAALLAMLMAMVIACRRHTFESLKL